MSDILVKDLRAELAAATAEIERLTEQYELATALSNTSIARSLECSDQLAAEQAKNVGLREEFQAFIDSHEECTDSDGFTAQIVSMDDYHKAVEALESAQADTSALEAMIAKAGEKMRERCINVAWNNEPDCNGPIEVGIRALPGVTLEDLK